jgi:hypothetical protein
LTLGQPLGQEAARWCQLGAADLEGLPRRSAQLPRLRGPLQIVAYVTDQLAINKILDHLGLSPPEEARPPPEVRYVPIDDEGRELPGMVAE